MQGRMTGKQGAFTAHVICQARTAYQRTGLWPGSSPTAPSPEEHTGVLGLPTSKGWGETSNSHRALHKVPGEGACGPVTPNPWRPQTGGRSRRRPAPALRGASLTRRGSTRG